MPLPQSLIAVPNVPSALHVTTELPLHVLPSAGSQSRQPTVPWMHPPVPSPPASVDSCRWAEHALAIAISATRTTRIPSCWRERDGVYRWEVVRHHRPRVASVTAREHGASASDSVSA